MKNSASSRGFTIYKKQKNHLKKIYKKNLRNKRKMKETTKEISNSKRIFYIQKKKAEMKIEKNQKNKTREKTRTKLVGTNSIYNCSLPTSKPYNLCFQLYF